MSTVLQVIRRASLMPLGICAVAILGTGQTFSPASMLAQSVVTDDTLTKLLTQGGAVAVLIIVLWSYRRDFFRRIEDKESEIRRLREEKETLQEVLDRSTAAITSSVLATTNQTSATHRLARTVEAIERKMDERRRLDGQG